MSLHALAQDMSSKGRHGDSMLVHMAPNEVAGLHALAHAHGEKLTINPETGLPEAFKLRSLLPTILGFALAPATGGASLGLTKMWHTAALVGAGFGLAKGSLKEGLLAGLGAYGGAGLAGSLANAGVSEAAAKEAFKKSTVEDAVRMDLQERALTDAAANAATSTTSTAGSTAAGTTAGASATAPATGLESAVSPVQTATPMPSAAVQGAPMAPITGEEIARAGFQAGVPPTGLEALSQGAQSIYDKGTLGQFATANKRNLYAAGASALMSPENEEEMPETKRDPGYIRPARYNWRTGTYEYFEPVKASEWGTRNLSEYTNPNDPRARATIGAKDGGLMALANGGAIAFDDGGFVAGGGRNTLEQEAAFARIKQEQDAAAAAKLAAYTPSDPILAPMLARGVKGMLHGETDEQAYNRIKQMDMDRTTRMANRDALRAQMGLDGVAVDGVVYGAGASGSGGGGTNTQPGGPYTPTPGPSNPSPPMPGTPPIATSTTGGSRAAYEYLSGKQGAAYPVNPYLPIDPATGKPVNVGVPYWKAMGMTDPYKGPKPMGGVNDPNKMPTEPAGVGKKWEWSAVDKRWNAVPDSTPIDTGIDMAAGAAGGAVRRMALGGLGSLAGGGQAGYNLGGYSDGGRLLKGPGDGVSDSIPATIGGRQPARLADGEFVVPARIVSELGNGSTEAGARKLYAMMDRVQKARGKTTGKKRVAVNSRADKYLPA